MPTMSKERTLLRSKLARAVQRGDRDEAETLRTEYRTASAAQYITELLATAPPLNVEQRERLAALLVGGAE